MFYSFYLLFRGRYFPFIVNYGKVFLPGIIFIVTCQSHSIEKWIIPQEAEFVKLVTDG